MKDKLAELKQQRMELVDEKAEITQELRDVNLQINKGSTPELKKARAEIISHLQEVETELRQINAEIMENSESSRPDILLVCPLFAARLGAGLDKAKALELALEDLAFLKSQL